METEETTEDVEEMVTSNPKWDNDDYKRVYCDGKGVQNAVARSTTPSPTKKTTGNNDNV